MTEVDAATHHETDSLDSPDFRQNASADEFRHALESRMLVERAVGIVMGRNDCTSDVASSTLQRTAETFDVTVLELARGLIATSNEGTH